MFPTLLNFLWQLIQAFTVYSLITPAVFCLFYFIRRNTKKHQSYDEELHEEKDYAIIISDSKSPENVYALLQSLRQLDYTNYLVYVTGNYASTANICLYQDKLVYLRTTRAYHSRFLHRFVIENFKRPHTHVVVLNGNSIVDKDYLTCLNSFFNQGYQAVTSRQSQLYKTGIGNMLQSTINSYRNFFAGNLVFSLGSSATLSCSGMAFTVSCYKQCLKQIKTENTGFASVLQTSITKRSQQVAFASNACVYRNSPATMRQFTGQHAQRVHDWLICLLFSCKTIAKGIRRGNINQLVSGISSLQMPLPTSILIGFACLAVNARIQPAMVSPWAGILLLFPLYLAIAAAQLPEQNQQRESQNKENDFESISLYEPEDGYEAIMQTV